MAKKKESVQVPEFLAELVEAASPSGHEYGAQEVLEKHIKPVADAFEKDVMGNRFATLNGKGAPVVMLAGHMDELGLMVKYVDEKGFLYFDTIGGHDLSIIPGRRVVVLTSNGLVSGVTGKRAIHLMTPEDRKKVPEIHDLWVDIGAKTKAEALERVAIGDTIVYRDGIQALGSECVVGRALDNKSGCYVVMEVFKRLAKHKKKLAAKVVSVATAQEEIGVRGAVTASYAVHPDVAIAVDVGHATDFPSCDSKKYGEFGLGKGPIVAKGPNINPVALKKLLEIAKENNIPVQVEAEAGPTGTDARAIQMTRGGVATLLVSIPLRYMHTASEMANLNDIENAVKLIVAFIESLSAKDKFSW